jgi:enamine deaminase RidA (YjgF/YER057c/UK114 family)
VSRVESEEGQVVTEPELVVSRNWGSFFTETGVPAAARLGDVVRVSGHTGTLDDGTCPVDLEAQIRQTFVNLTETLEAAHTNWPQVTMVRSYHVGLHAQVEPLLRVAAEFMDTPFPPWTAVGVTELFEDDAVIEIECEADLRVQA